MIYENLKTFAHGNVLGGRLLQKSAYSSIQNKDICINSIYVCSNSIDVTIDITIYIC